MTDSVIDELNQVLANDGLLSIEQFAEKTLEFFRDDIPCREDIDRWLDDPTDIDNLERVIGRLKDHVDITDPSPSPPRRLVLWYAVYRDTLLRIQRAA